MRPQQNWKRCKYASRHRRTPARTLYGKPARHHCARTAMPQDGAASLRQGGNAASRRGIIASGRRSMNIPLDHIDVRYSIFATPAFIHPPDCVENPFFSGSIHKWKKFCVLRLNAKKYYTQNFLKKLKTPQKGTIYTKKSRFRYESCVFFHIRIGILHNKTRACA